MTNPDRIPCVVPFCRRTAKRLPEDTDDVEIICGKHYRLADARLRRNKTLALRRANRAYEKCLSLKKTDPFADLMVEQGKYRRLYWLHNRIWDLIKIQAIERAVGIS